MCERPDAPFRAMRRAAQQLSDAECIKILAEGSHGVLAVHGDGGYPYAVPLSYVYADGAILFHCARAGHKLDAIRKDPKVSFCVVARDDVAPEAFTTHYRSVIAFGRAAELPPDGAEFSDAIDRLAAKYAPNASPQARAAEIARFRGALCMVRVTIDRITGKQAKELC